MSVEEKRMVRNMHFESDQTPTEIAEATGRDLSTIVRSLKAKPVKKKVGRPTVLTSAVVDRLQSTLDAMVQKVDGKKEVTVTMLKAKTKVKVGERAILDALHKRGVYFRPQRSKPVLTQGDIDERYKFAKEYRGKTKRWWLKNLHMVIDCKHFPVYTNGASRAYAARRTIRGAYRTKGQGLDKGYVAVPKSLRYNTGAKSVMIAAGVGAGKVLLWEEIQGRWNGQAAADLYTGPMKKILSKTYPTKRRFTVLEDNDPSGFKSSKGIAAKADAKIDVFAIPPHSPDLNVCDYALWKEITNRMRAEEEGWPTSKRESRDQYLARLKKTAKGLPKKLIEDSMGDMARRCARLYDKKGNYFEEGGKGA